MTDDYSDVIDLPHHVSPRHKPMSLLNRAAQFAPFAALTGHEEAIENTAQQNRDWWEEHDAPVDEWFWLFFRDISSSSYFVISLLHYNAMSI